MAGVVLLHGISRTARSMRAIERAVGRAGLPALNLDYPSRRRPLGELAQGLAPAMARFAAGVDGPVHFVTHSMGGLVARALLTAHRPERLGRVVMLAPPNGGSEIADLLGGVALYRRWFGPAGGQLGTRRDEALIELLGPVDYKLGLIAGDRSLYPLSSMLLPRPNDGRVSVAATRVEGAADHIVLPVSHPRIMSDPRAIAEVLAFLRDGRFGRAG